MRKKKRQEIEEAINDLRRIYHAINQYSRTAERETGLTGPQLWALQLLFTAAPMRLSTLAAGMYLRPATVVGIVDRLEAKGLVTRTRSQDDRRAVDLALTPKGEEVVANAPQAAQTMLLKGLEALGEQELDLVVEGMKLMVRILGAEKITPQPLSLG
ncbi:MarR family transcriptional regulator [Geomonas sp. Red32]|uniref:MarR family winged helix-turn-helix transcriptional regulator n=1 Tax=Geomonas sp. Red32 TaxID=2912856 RepID=UPI00202CFAB6|nr:MarR family transcriptional regulator [Geomonas sp. Red32]